jgi:hypothetical protein
MVNTSLNSLAQNLDTKEWPLKGEEEKPSKYIGFTWDELLLLPEFGGKAERIEHLVSILQETLAFDDPFGDMVATADAAAAAENPIKKTLEKLGIPENFPLALAKLSPDVRGFCEAQGLHTVGEFAGFAQTVAQRIVIGGDFRSLLNALVHGDEEGIGQHLPFRRGAQGLHLAEGVGLALASLTRPELLALAKNLGVKLTAADAAAAKVTTKDEFQKIEAAARSRVEAMTAWFKDDCVALAKLLREGGSLERYFIVLNDPAREGLAIKFIQPALKGVLPAKAAGSAPAGVPAPVKKRGFFSRLFGRE